MRRRVSLCQLVTTECYPYRYPSCSACGGALGSRKVRSLLQSKKYITGQDFLAGFASIALFLDAVGWKQVLYDHAPQYANDVITDPARWVEISAEVEAELYAGDFASWKGRQMPPNIADEFQERLDDRKDAIEREMRMNDEDRVIREYEDGLAWVGLFKTAFLAARIEEGKQNIEIRAEVRTTVGD